MKNTLIAPFLQIPHYIFTLFWSYASKDKINRLSSESYNKFESTFKTISDHLIFLTNYTEQLFCPNPQTNTLLDIGSGPGFIAHDLLNKYKSITSLDTNKYYAPYYKKLKKKKDTFNYIIGDFHTLPISKKYSNILCAHMMYYIPQKEWNTFIYKILDSLEEKGEALIVLTAPSGRLHKLRKSINPNYAHSKVLRKILEKESISYISKIYTNEYIEFERKKYEDLISIFTVDNCFLPFEFDSLSKNHKQKLDIANQKFIKHSYDKKKNGYVLYEDCEYFHLKKT